MANGGGAPSSRVIITNSYSNPLSNINEGRLTVVSGQAIPVDVDGSGNPIQIGTGHNNTLLYYTPYKGNRISLYVSGVWVLYTFAELQISNAGLGDSLNPLVGPYDVFAFLNGSGDVALEFGPAYGQFTRPANRIVLQDGVQVKFGDPTRKLIGTIATVSVGNHTAPFLFWDGSNVRFVSNLYNAVPLYGYGQEGYVDDDTKHAFAVSPVSGGLWQIPLFIGPNVNGISWPGHVPPLATGDGIYANWVCCEPRRVRVHLKVNMENNGATVYGAGIVINAGDDIYDATLVVMSTETTDPTLDDEITTEFTCPPGVFGSFAAFFAEGGSQTANVVVNDKRRGAAVSPRLTYSRAVVDL